MSKHEMQSECERKKNTNINSQIYSNSKWQKGTEILKPGNNHIKGGNKHKVATKTFSGQWNCQLLLIQRGNAIPKKPNYKNESFKKLKYEKSYYPITNREELNEGIGIDSGEANPFSSVDLSRLGIRGTDCQSQLHLKFFL